MAMTPRAAATPPAALRASGMVRVDLRIGRRPLAEVVALARLRFDERALLRLVPLLGPWRRAAVPVDLAGVVDGGVVGLAVRAAGVVPLADGVVGSAGGGHVRDALLDVRRRQRRAR